MANTRIEWATKSWNPVKMRCTKISPGCDNCYAQRFLGRNLPAFSGYPKPGEPPVLDVVELEKPGHWRKPSLIFVCSMGDLFHESVPNSFIDDVFEVMTGALYGATHHTFIILTKRPERILKGHAERFAEWKNIWLCVTAENQEQANKRIPILREIPAAVRGVSVEPMLGEIEFTYNRFCGVMGWGPPDPPRRNEDKQTSLKRQTRWILGFNKISWIICGGETGPGSRPMHPEWVRSLRNQCQAAGIPFFFKSWGDWDPLEIRPELDTAYHRVANGELRAYPNGYKRHWWGGSWGDGKPLSVRAGKKQTGRLLDGRTWDEFPK